jgi:hypothetical protein
MFCEGGLDAIRRFARFPWPLEIGPRSWLPLSRYFRNVTKVDIDIICGLS